jgi:tRNA (guanine37-N1)-methyltransferase
VDEEVSIGDYVISSGELAAMVIIDAVYRLRDGMLRESSVSDESFEDGLLEYPHYTRPEHFRGRDVPEVLISGHHANIERWRRRQRIIRTARQRPDLLAEAPLSDEEIRFVREELGRSE